MAITTTMTNGDVSNNIYMAMTVATMTAPTSYRNDCDDFDERLYHGNDLQKIMGTMFRMPCCHLKTTVLRKCMQTKKNRSVR